MSLRQKAVKGIVWTATQNWGGQAISFVVFSVLARLLGPEAFGLVALASVFIAFLQVFLDQGFTQALIQRQELDPEHLDTAFWTNLAIGMLLTGLGVAAASLVADWFKQPQLTPVVRWLSLSFLIGSLRGVQQALFSRRFAFKALAVRSLVAVLVGGVVGLSMAFLGFGVWSLVAQQLANAFAGVLVLWWASDWRPGLKISVKHFRDLFNFGINIVGFNLLDFFNRRADNFLVGYFLGPVALGYYTVAYRVLLVMIQLLTSTINQVALPTFSRLQKEPGRLRQAFFTATQLTSLISFPTFLGMAVLAPELVVVLFGTQWIPSIPVMQVLAFIGILQSVYYFNGSVILAMGKPGWRVWLNCLNAVTNVVAFAVAVRWGIVAVAAAYVLRGYLFSPISILMIRRLIQIELTVYLRQYAAPLLGSLAMVATIFVAKYFLKDFMGLGLLLAICIAIGAVVYGVTLWLTAPALLRQVLDLVRSAVSGRKAK